MRHKDWIPARARARWRRPRPRSRRRASVASTRWSPPARRPSTACARASRAASSSPTTRAWRPRRVPAPWAGGCARRATSAALPVSAAPDELVDAMAHVEAELLLAGAIGRPRSAASSSGRRDGPACATSGRVDHGDVTGVLAQAKVGVIPLHPHPAYRDALPVKLFEYLAAGLAVISIDVSAVARGARRPRLRRVRPVRLAARARRRDRRAARRRRAHTGDGRPRAQRGRGPLLMAQPGGRAPSISTASCWHEPHSPRGRPPRASTATICSPTASPRSPSSSPRPSTPATRR